MITHLYKSKTNFTLILKIKFFRSKMFNLNIKVKLDFIVPKMVAELIMLQHLLLTKKEIKE